MEAFGSFSCCLIFHKSLRNSGYDRFANLLHPFIFIDVHFSINGFVLSYLKIT
jgi:hypothetical protein